jgi:dTDP-glucose 4,6-dehydratase
MKGGIKFLQVSTDEVYGSIESGSWDENCNLSPNSPYSASKAASDLITLAMHKTHGMDVMVSRCCNNYGPRQHEEKLIPKIIKQTMANIPLTIYGDGKNIREWIEVSDHCKALANILVNGKAGEIYNIGSGDELDNISVVQNILKCIPSSKSKVKFIEDRKGHDFRYSINDSKYRTFGPPNSKLFSIEIDNTVQWYVNTKFN